MSDEDNKPTIRTVHHFACSGGTLISKCIASMPNVLLLSELDPLSPLSPLQEKHQKPEFSPSDPIRLLKHNLQDLGDEVLVSMFVASILDLSKHCKRLSYDLVLRDHTHSHYCCGAELSDRASFLRMLTADFRVKSIVTVRHPLDSYISLSDNGWLHFTPTSLDEYSRRYNLFLDEYEGVEIFKYEDFTKTPEAVLLNICETLSIEFDPGFQKYISAIRLTGDSGRSSNVIQERPRKPKTEELSRQIAESENYRTLCARLFYDA